MWIAQILLAIIGLSSGMIVAAGLFAFITGLGVISDFADRTQTASAILLYEDCLSLGGILGNIVFLFQPNLSFVSGLLGVFGLFSGIFVGCWSMALAETLNMFPIFIRRSKLVQGIPYLILGAALGKGLGACIYALF